MYKKAFEAFILQKNIFIKITNSAYNRWILNEIRAFEHSYTKKNIFINNADSMRAIILKKILLLILVTQHIISEYLMYIEALNTQKKYFY